MSNALPHNANMDWLKKHAKRRLAALRKEDPDAKLTQVHFEVAKEYGFSSWRSLKAHIEQHGQSGSRETSEIDGFLRSAAEGNLQVVKQALENNPELVNAVGKHPFWGGQPQVLHLAIEGNRQDLFDVLLAAGADVNGTNAGYDNWSPLMLALFNGKDAMVHVLRDRGAHIGLCEALLSGDDERLNDYLADPDVRTKPRPSGSILGLARTEYAVNRLLNEGFFTDDTDRWGSDALDSLSRLGRRGQPLVQALVAKRGKLRGVDAARFGDKDMLKALAAQDASVLTDDSVFMAAVDFREMDLVTWLLDQGANVNARHDFGSNGTALHSAAWSGDVDLIKLLLEHGANANALDEEYKTTPLIWAQTARFVTNNPRCDDAAEVLSKSAPV